MARASSMISCTLAVVGSMSTWRRAVITSEAVRSENSRVRATKLAVPASRVPRSAERRTIEDSSSGERAPDSSSFGSMPSPCSTALAVPFISTTSGFITAVNISWGRAMARPTG